MICQLALPFLLFYAWHNKETDGQNQKEPISLWNIEVQNWDHWNYFYLWTWEFKSARDHTAGKKRKKKAEAKCSRVKVICNCRGFHLLPAQIVFLMHWRNASYLLSRWEKIPDFFTLLSVYHPSSQSRILLWFGSPLQRDYMIASRNIFLH